MATIALTEKEAADRLGDILARVGSGEEVTISVEGRDVARVVPAARAAGSQESAREETFEEKRERILRDREKTHLKGLRIVDLIQEGRR